MSDESKRRTLCSERSVFHIESEFMSDWSSCVSGSIAALDIWLAIDNDAIWTLTRPVRDVASIIAMKCRHFDCDCGVTVHHIPETDEQHTLTKSGMHSHKPHWRAACTYGPARRFLCGESAVEYLKAKEGRWIQGTPLTYYQTIRMFNRTYRCSVGGCHKRLIYRIQDLTRISGEPFRIHEVAESVCEHNHR
jgi:hypothetical protein